MARAATTSDVFNAVAERQRRDVLDLLRSGERSVLSIGDELSMPQPSVSRHLRILRDVDLVSVRQTGTQRIYRLQPTSLRPIHSWVGGFERFWSESFDRLDAYAAHLAAGDLDGPGR